MGAIRPWRIAAMLAVPVSLLVMQDRCFMDFLGYYHERGHTLRDDVQRAVRTTSGRTYNVRTVDSVLRATPSLRVNDQVAIKQIGNAPAERIGAVRQQLQDELARLPVRDTGARIVVVAQFGDIRGRLPGASTWTAPGWSPCVYRGRLDNPSRQDSLNVVLPALLGQCSLALMYGEPGPAVRSWIRTVIGYNDTRAAFEHSGNAVRDAQGRAVIDVPEAIGQWGALTQQDLHFFGCRSGELPSCRTGLEDFWASSLRGDFIWWLATSRPQQFARFWHAGGSYEEAAQSAFGEPLTSLMSQYLSKNFVVEGTGPSPPASAAWVVPAVVAASLLVALLAGRQRSPA